MSASISHAHELPRLFLDFKGEKAVLRISRPDHWRDRSDNTYKINKEKIESAIIDNPEETSAYVAKRYNSLISAGTEIDAANNKYKGNFKKAVIEEFFPLDNRNILENHFALMKDCRGDHCPLTRSENNTKRREFEDDFVERVMRRYNFREPLRYIGFGVGMSLLGDLRILMKLKKAGYEFQKIQFIDPSVEEYLSNIKLLIKTWGATDRLTFPANVNDLETIFNKVPGFFGTTMMTHVLAQFLAILSNYSGNEVIEYYPNVKAYNRDKSNKSQKAHIITTLDLFDQMGRKDGKNEKALSDFKLLKKLNPNALAGSLYARFRGEDPKSTLHYGNKSWKYTLVSATNECEQCEKLIVGENYCNRCKCKKSNYCSIDCLRENYASHKKLFHTKKIKVK